MSPVDESARRNEQDALREEIRHFEAHLARIAAADDCAYDKARMRTCEALLQDRRHRLHALDAIHRQHD